MIDHTHVTSKGTTRGTPVQAAAALGMIALGVVLGRRPSAGPVTR